MNEHMVKLIRPSGIGISFLNHHRRDKFQGNSTSEGALNTWVGKFSIFDRNRCLSRKRYEIGPWLLWNVNRKSSNGGIFNDLDEPLFSK